IQNNQNNKTKINYNSLFIFFIPNSLLLKLFNFFFEIIIIKIHFTLKLTHPLIHVGEIQSRKFKTFEKMQPIFEIEISLTKSNSKSKFEIKIENRNQNRNSKKSKSNLKFEIKFKIKIKMIKVKLKVEIYIKSNN